MSFSPDMYDVVDTDEFRHAEAATYRCLLDHLAPTELLRLTASPERSDGTDVRDWFGGRAAPELGLSVELEAELLCPLHYIGVSDETDLSELDWRQGTTTPPPSPASTPPTTPVSA